VSKKSTRPNSSQLVPDDLEPQLVQLVPPLHGDEVWTGDGEGTYTEDVVRPDGTGLYGVIVPCPNCGEVRYMIGPEGKPQRKCWACGHVFTPEIKQIDKVEQIVEWWKTPAEYNWSGTIKELLEGLAEGKPLKLTIVTVRVPPEPEPESFEGRKRCPFGHECHHEPSGSAFCCGSPGQPELFE
jgi:hypothetical protein